MDPFTQRVGNREDYKNTREGGGSKRRGEIMLVGRLKSGAAEEL